MTPKNSLKQSIVEGALAGLWVWLIYGVVEFALALTIPQLWAPERELLPWQWPLIALLFGMYALVGLLSGAAGGACLARSGRTPSRASHRSWACMIFSVVFAMNLIPAWPLARSETIALVMAAVLAAAYCGALVSQSWQRRTAFLTAPGILSLLLLIGPWISREAMASSSGWVKTGTSVLAMACLLGVAAFWHRMAPATPARMKAAAVLVVAGLLWTGIQAPGTIAIAQDIPSAAPSSQGKPNILLITMDTVRADHVSAYGYERDTTPYLRQFAQQSTQYERMIACDGFTLPTHASLFTGLYPSWHGAIRRPERSSGAPLPPNTRTLASVLRANGFRTAEIAANFGYLGKWSGLTQGFASPDIRMAAHLSDSNRPFFLRESARKLLNLATRTADFDGYTLRASDINRHAFAALEEARNQRSPFFLFLNYMDAHSPYLPEQPFRDQFSSADRDLKPISAEAFVTLRDTVNAGKRVLTEPERRYLISQYDAGIADVDFHIGKLIARLRELGLYENTLIIVTGDHGESFGDHKLLEHAFGSLYQDQLQVPLFVKYPGQHEAHRSDALVSQVDFLPTVLDVTGIAELPGLQGQSLRSPRAPDSGVVFAESAPRVDLNANTRLRGSRRAMFSENLKLIVWSAGDPELYDLSTDPNELHNLYQPADPRVAPLMARLNVWTAAIPARPAQPAKPADKSTMDKLRSLGYIK